MKPNKQKIESIILNTNLIHGKLCQDGDHCIIGALLQRAGFTDEEMNRMSQSVREEQNSWKRGLERIKELFGLNREQVRKLMSANDVVGHYGLLKDRRKRLLDRLAEIEKWG